MFMMRFAFAALLLWHPGFSEQTAYTILIVNILIDSASEIVKIAAKDGLFVGLAVGVLVSPFWYLLWHQTLLAEHTALKWYCILSGIGAVLSLLLVAVIAHNNSPRTRVRHLR